MTEPRRKELFDEEKFHFIRNAGSMGELTRFINSEIERNRKEAAQDAILGAMKYLHALEMGDQMCCLVCKEGNDDLTPKHKENCELREFIDAALKERGVE